MLFNSYSFLIFFLVVLIVSRLVGNWTTRKAFLLLVSYGFYAVWNPPFVVLIWISTLVDWFVSRKVYACNNGKRRFRLLLISLAVNLGMLAYFKYGDFFLDNINILLESLGVSWRVGEMHVILPIGISFYTFQTLSYTIDIYRKKLRPSKSALDYALFVTFFPQLVAGPIVRASDFLPQCIAPKLATPRQLGWGLIMIVIGLFAKVVVADKLSSPISDLIFTSATTNWLNAWTGTLAFAMQIFYDFFGYSTCAIGVALCLGFALPDNFRFPYAACGFSDFWQRWHISLSSWLRDYLYISLGGNQKGHGRTQINLAITMLLGGLWHGASWMFVIWGGLHGSYLMAERLCKATFISDFKVWDKWYGNLFLTMLTFSMVCITWVFFRAPDLDSAFAMCSSMLNPVEIARFLLALVQTPGSLSCSSSEADWLGIATYGLVFLTTAATLLIHFTLRHSSIEQFYEKLPTILRLPIIAFMVYLILISMTGQENAFIYFQF